MKFDHAIFIDVDGTLLTNEHVVTRETYAAIRQLFEKKVLVVLTTARPPDGVLFIAEELGISHFPIICLNGALILNNGQIVFNQAIAPNLLSRVLNHIQNNIVISFYEKRNWFVNIMNSYIDIEMEITKMKAIQMNENELLAKWKTNGTGPNKLLCLGASEEMHLLQSKLQSFHELNIYLSKPTYLEITDKASSKKKAMDWVLEKFGIPCSNSIAIGDGFNDRDMIAGAGFGIAMGNAPEKVKSVANFITFTNEENGVAYAIERLMMV